MSGSVGTPIDSSKAWADLEAWLPEMLEQLLSSEVYNLNSRPPKGKRGIYLFSEEGQHLYIGRTGITARSRAKGEEPITSFRHRFDQHTQLGRPPGASSFASRLLREHAGELGLAVPSVWWPDRRTSARRSMACIEWQRSGSEVWNAVWCRSRTTLRASDPRSPRYMPMLTWELFTTTFQPPNWRDQHACIMRLQGQYVQAQIWICACTHDKRRIFCAPRGATSTR